MADVSKVVATLRTILRHPRSIDGPALRLALHLLRRAIPRLDPHIVLHQVGWLGVDVEHALQPLLLATV